MRQPRPRPVARTTCLTLGELVAAIHDRVERLDLPPTIRDRVEAATVASLLERASESQRSHVRATLCEAAAA
jgi:hypothetical protein